MLLTKKSHDVNAHGAGSARFVQSLSRGLSNALPTMDRRAFLRRSGLGVGVGLAATQLSLVKKANAAAPGAAGDLGHAGPAGRLRSAQAPAANTRRRWPSGSCATKV